MSTEKINGIIIYCSDPRTEKANLWKHIKTHLILPEQRLAPIGLLGGIISLAHPTYLPLEFAFLMRQIDFVFKNEHFAHARSFVLVGHDCGYYAQIPDREFTIEDKKIDVGVAAKFLRERFQMPVKGFFKLAGTGFEEIP